MYTETVVDFNFCIDIVPNGPPIQWSVADDQPAYRGLMVPELEAGTGKRIAKGQELKRQEQWEAKKNAQGLPPWVREEDTHTTDGFTFDGLKSSKTIQQWANEYCASPKYLKKFLYKKVGAHLSFSNIPFFLNLCNPTGLLWLGHGSDRVCYPI